MLGSPAVGSVGLVDFANLQVRGAVNHAAEERFDGSTTTSCRRARGPDLDAFNVIGGADVEKAIISRSKLASLLPGQSVQLDDDRVLAVV
jgi:hypothetical protein